MKKNSFLEGTIIASLAIIITKIIGALYVIPFYSIIGEDGGILYSYAYNIYNLFLNISTAGIPVAISMLISEYQSLNLIDAKERTYKLSKKIILIFSLIAFLILFIFADYFALFMQNNITGGSSLNNIALVIRTISFCLLITPLLSVIRGYLQGNKIITPSSISQVIEQIIRIIIVILGSYISINILNTSVPIGVSVALTGAFFGGLIAYIYLKIKIKKEQKVFEKPTKKDNISNKEIIKKIITYCIPLILISVISNLYDLIDMKLIIKGLYTIGYDAKTCELISSIIATWGPKICMIIVAISMGLTTSLIPHMISSYVKKDFKEVNNKFNQAISTIIAITTPMALGVFFLAEPIYTLFYGESYYGPLLLKYLAILNIFTGTLTIMNTALQGMKKFKIIYLNSFTGLAINTLLDIPLIIIFDKIGIYPFYGTITASIIGCLVSYIIVIIYLNKNFKFTYTPIIKTIIKTIISSIVMFITLKLISLVIPLTGTKITLIIKSLFYALIGIIIYITVSYKTKLLQDIFGKENIIKIKNKLSFKKLKKTCI